MFDHYLSDILKIKRAEVDSKSFYCGDAAGRKENNDFSSDDLLFSVNIVLNFYTPEMFFKDSPINFKVISGCKVEGELKKEEVKSDPKAIE